MLSSWQIAALHEQQAQALAPGGVQPLSAPPPTAYGGAAGPGPISNLFNSTGGRFGAGPGPGFSYGAGRGSNTAFGNLGVSTVAGLGQSYSQGLGMSGAMMGFSAGGGFAALGKGAFGGVMGGTLMGAGLGMGVGAIGQHVFGSMVSGAQEQQQLERTLSQFRFANPSSRSGQGFTRQDQRAIGDMVRHMERMPEMLTSFGELNRLMDKMGQMGLMQGVKSATDFMTKFKSTTDTLKDMAKMMGTTMEGALQAFGEARMSGFYSNADIMRNTMNRQVTSAATGMSQEQVAQVQQFGAEASHARGGSRRGGAMSITRTAQQFGVMNQLGILTNDQIMEMTGKEGADGIADLSAGMNNLAYRMAKSSVGTATALALGEQVDGRYTGRMDQELSERYRSGGLSKSELLGLAHKKAGTRGAKLSFAAHRDRITTEMANEMGPEGIAMEIERLVGSRGIHNKDAVNLVLQRFGASEEESNLIQQMMPKLDEIKAQMAVQRKHQARESARTLAMEPQSWDAIKTRIATRIKHATTDWAKDLGVSVRDYFTEWSDNFVDEMTGTYRTQITQRSMNTINRAAAGNKGAAQYLSRIAGSNQAEAGKPYELWSTGGLLNNTARGLLSLGGEVPYEQQQIMALKTAMGSQYSDYIQEKTSGPSAGGWILGGLTGLISPVAGAAIVAGSRDTSYSASREGITSWNKRVDAASADAARNAQALRTSVGDDRFQKAQATLLEITSRPAVRGAQTEQERARLTLEAMQKQPSLGMDLSMFTGGTPGLEAREEGWQKKQFWERPMGMGEGDYGAQANLQSVMQDMRKSRGLGPNDTSQDMEIMQALRQGTQSKGRMGDASGFRISPITGKALARKQRDLDQAIRGKAVFSGIMDEVSGDTPLGRALAGQEGGDKGLLFRDTKAGDDDVLRAEKFNKEQREFLARQGYNDQAITKFEEDFEGRQKIADMRDKMSPEEKKQFGEWLRTNDAAALDKYMQDSARYGKELASSTNVKKTGSAAYLSRTTKGKSDKFMGAARAYGESLEKMKERYEHGDMGGMAAMKDAEEAAFKEFEGLDNETKRSVSKHLRDSGQVEFLQIAEERRGISRRAKEARKRGGKNKMDVWELAGRDERTAFGGDVGMQETYKFLADPKAYTEHQAALARGEKDDKYKAGVASDRVSAAELYLKQGAESSITKPGVRTDAAGASEEKINQYFEKLNSNAAATASLLTVLAGKMGVSVEPPAAGGKPN